MTDLDAMDLFTETPATPTGAGPRRHRHSWMLWAEELTRHADLGPHSCCRMCGALRDEARSRRGRSSRRLGNDQERGFERDHGPTKIGERGDPVDHLGALGKYQVKSTRGEVPHRLRHIDRMVGLYGDRVPILVERFVHVGRRTETYLTLRLRDWQALHGRDEETT